MRRIITNNYIRKLDELVGEFKGSPNLNSLIDFFIEEVQKDQNRKGKKNQKIFSSNDLEKLYELKNSAEFKRIFAYINIIVNAFSGQYLHIHINVDLSEKQLDNITTIFAWDVLCSGLYNNVILSIEEQTLSSRISREVYFKDNNGHSQNKIRRERKGLHHRLNLINQIVNFENDNLKKGKLLNINTSSKDCVNLSEFSVFPNSLNTYVNFGNSRKNIFKEMGLEKVEKLSMIINLFPSITGKNIWYKDFMSDEINRYNNFNKVITITSGEKTSEALLEMQRQKKFQAEEIYTIFSFEL